MYINIFQLTQSSSRYIFETLGTFVMLRSKIKQVTKIKIQNNYTYIYKLCIYKQYTFSQNKTEIIKTDLI